MNATKVIAELQALGFTTQVHGAYGSTTRLKPPNGAPGSVFVGEGPDVIYGGQVTIMAADTFLIANGRSLPDGMTKTLLALGTQPSGRIPDPRGRPPEDDDPYWCGEKLHDLLAKMADQFR